MYIIQQGQFWHRRQSSFSRHSREKSRFEFSVCVTIAIARTYAPCFCLQTITLSSMDKLLRHIEESQLTSDLGGFLPYNHNEWITFRLVSDFTPTIPHTVYMYCIVEKISKFGKYVCKLPKFFFLELLLYICHIRAFGQTFLLQKFYIPAAGSLIRQCFIHQCLLLCTISKKQ